MRSNWSVDTWLWAQLHKSEPNCQFSRLLKELWSWLQVGNPKPVCPRRCHYLYAVFHWSFGNNDRCSSRVRWLESNGIVIIVNKKIHVQIWSIQINFVVYAFWTKNKMAHIGLAMFHGIGTVCAGVGIWNFEENCCRVDLEWDGIGFIYQPAVHEFGYPRNNMHCNCWLTKRESRMENGERLYSTALWEPQHYPGRYDGEESTFVSFAAHHIHIHMAALVRVNILVHFVFKLN